MYINVICLYLFDNIQFIWSVVKQGVESVSLCEEKC